MGRLVTVLVLVLAGCGDDDFVRTDVGPVEMDSDVPIDTGPIEVDAGGQDSGPSGCTVRDGVPIIDTCVGDQICICPGTAQFCEAVKACETAYGRRYRIGVFTVSLPDRDPAGDCWDEPGCGAPDPYATITLDGIELGRTEAASDIFDGVYDPPFIADGSISAGSTVNITFFDEDPLGADEFAAGCAWEGLDAFVLRGRDLSCAGPLGSIGAFVAPL